MPYKEKTSKGTIWIAKVVRNSHRKRRIFPTKGQAIAWESEQKGLPLEQYLNETPTEYSLAEWAEQYLDFVKGRFTDGVYEEKQRAFREFFKTVDPKMEAAKLHAGEVLKHFAKQANARSGGAANKDRKNLIAAWNWAMKYLPKWPSENPFAKTDKQVSEQHPRYIPPTEDFWKVYDSAREGQDKVMLLAYLHTAARRTELFTLTWQDVDFEGERIRLWTRKRKGGKEYDWIPMTSELRDALSGWYESRTFTDSQFVFMCEDKFSFCEDHYGNPFKVRRFWLPRLCTRAGVKTFGFHAIRHLSASILDDAGYPITVIQALLRHKNANTTARYLHKLRGMREVLDDAFKRKSPTDSEKASGRPNIKLIAPSAKGPEKGPNRSDHSEQLL